MSQYNSQYPSSQAVAAEQQQSTAAHAQPHIPRLFSPIYSVDEAIAMLQQMNRGVAARLQQGIPMETIAASPNISAAMGEAKPMRFRDLDTSPDVAFPPNFTTLVYSAASDAIRENLIRAYLFGAKANASRVCGVLCVGPSELPFDDYKRQVLDTFLGQSQELDL